MSETKYSPGTTLLYKTAGVRGAVVPNNKLPGDICVLWETGQSSSYDEEFLDLFCEVVPATSEALTENAVAVEAVRVARIEDELTKRCEDILLLRKQYLRALAEWDKFSLFSLPHLPEGEDREQRIEAVLAYMLRQLSRGRVPRVEYVRATLVEGKPIPTCGYINCRIDALEDHVH